MGETQEVKQAFHRLKLDSGETIEGPIVVVYRDGLMSRWYALEKEEPSVIWKGGVGTQRI